MFWDSPILKSNGNVPVPKKSCAIGGYPLGEVLLYDDFTIFTILVLIFGFFFYF